MLNEETSKIPTHIGYIVDGNRRWARQHGLPTYEGHLAGYHALKEIVIETINQGVKYVSLYAFSTENWRRPEEEVSYLMKMALKVFKSDIKELIENQIRVSFAGSRLGLEPAVLAAMDEVEERTKEFTRGVAVPCFNYGGQQEIVDAVKACLKKGMGADQITEQTIAENLYVPEVPPLDLIVRTSGEQRLSNFMLWRAAYSELLFLDKFWPDMRKEDVSAIIEAYGQRSRRFGGS